MAGDWDSPDLVGLFTVFAENLAGLVLAPLQALRRWYIPRRSLLPRTHHCNAVPSSNGTYLPAHELFALFLDPSMTYSSALFAPGDTLAACAAPQDRDCCGPHRDRAGHYGAGNRQRLGGALVAIAAAARGAQGDQR